VLSGLLVLAILGGAALSGVPLNAEEAERGGPIYLYLGVAVWGSWAVLVMAAALACRTQWGRFAGIGLTSLVGVFGLALFSAQVD
jgi:hypothetical protein